MSFDLTHAIVSAIVIGVIVLLLETLVFKPEDTRGRRALITGGAVFAVLLVVNLFWPG